tara:strand:- start:701 stop:1201 length:501 start_codon:yes stop_codon:yes gene_type:complete
MILVDTNILSTFAKIDKLDLLLRLLEDYDACISPNVFEELNKANELGYSYVKKVFDLIDGQKIQIVSPQRDEFLLSQKLPKGFGSGERDSLAITKSRNLIFLTNDKKIINYCGKHEIDCLWLNIVLRLFWRENLLTKGEVNDLIDEIEIKDKIIITDKEGIFSEGE